MSATSAAELLPGTQNRISVPFAAVVAENTAPPANAVKEVGLELAVAAAVFGEARSSVQQPPPKVSYTQGSTPLYPLSPEKIRYCGGIQVRPEREANPPAVLFPLPQARTAAEAPAVREKRALPVCRVQAKKKVVVELMVSTEVGEEARMPGFTSDARASVGA